jgi:hypothetical protein
MIRHLATTPVPAWVVAVIVTVACAFGSMGAYRMGAESVDCPPPPVTTCPPPVVPECPPVVRQPDFGGDDGECPECVCRDLSDAVRWLEQRAGAGGAGE